MLPFLRRFPAGGISCAQLFSESPPLPPIIQSTRLNLARSNAGVPHTYTQVPGAVHGFLDSNTDDAAVCFTANDFQRFLNAFAAGCS